MVNTEYSGNVPSRANTLADDLSYATRPGTVSTKRPLPWRRHRKSNGPNRLGNPIVGCTKISAGCKHCYAETLARRLRAMGTPGYENGFALALLPHRLEEPLRRKKPSIYFVNSMSDLFHEKVPDSYIEQIVDVMAQTPQHSYQVLTKRAARMVRFFRARTVPDNVWLGVSVGKPPPRRSADRSTPQYPGADPFSFC